MGESEKKDEKEREDLWSSILNDVRVSGTQSRSTGAKNVIVLGDVCTGKSTLIDRLCQISGTGTNKSRRSQGNQGKFLLSGCSLEYRFIDVYDDETDDYLARMGIWTLDGVVWHSQLLQFALRENSVSDTVAMIIIDLSQPWNVLESLERWTQVLNKHVNSLKIPEKTRKTMEEDIVRAFQTYQNPEDQSNGGVLSGEGGADVILPLGDNILSCNIGLPIVVVCTKSDHFAQLEKSQSYKDEHFDFIQQHIRKFCLNYGAALIYTSTKDNKNISLLREYLVHKAYGLKFNIPASIIEREAVFIPSGWDNDNHIAVLCDQMKHINPREPLKNMIAPPRATVPLSEMEEVTAEDDQALLLVLQAYLSKAPKSSTSAPTSSTQKERSPRPSLNPSETMDTVKQSPSGGGGSGTGGGPGEQVLATFFNSLLTKNKGVSKGGKNSELDKIRGKTEK